MLFAKLLRSKSFGGIYYFDSREKNTIAYLPATYSVGLAMFQQQLV